MGEHGVRKSIGSRNRKARGKRGRTSRTEPRGCDPRYLHHRRRGFMARSLAHGFEPLQVSTTCAQKRKAGRMHWRPKN